MAAPKKAPTAPSAPPAAGANVQWRQPSKPNFVKIHEGEMYEGIFIGRVRTQYGPGYRFRGYDGEVFTIGGNRAQMDQIFEEALASPQGFIGDNIIGHSLILMRMKNTESKTGRKVATYQLGHDLDKCPKGCKG
jgi:hypothetical protein